MLPTTIAASTTQGFLNQKNSILVKIPVSGITYEVRVKETDTILFLKETIGNVIQVSSTFFKLIHNKSPLKPEKNLKDYGFKNGDSPRFDLTLKVSSCHLLKFFGIFEKRSY